MATLVQAFPWRSRSRRSGHGPSGGRRPSRPASTIAISKASPICRRRGTAAAARCAAPRRRGRGRRSGARRWRAGWGRSKRPGRRPAAPAREAEPRAGTSGCGARPGTASPSSQRRRAHARAQAPRQRGPLSDVQAPDDDQGQRSERGRGREEQAGGAGDEQHGDEQRAGDVARAIGPDVDHRLRRSLLVLGQRREEELVAGANTELRTRISTPRATTPSPGNTTAAPATATTAPGTLPRLTARARASLRARGRQSSAGGRSRRRRRCRRARSSRSGRRSRASPPRAT